MKGCCCEISDAAVYYQGETKSGEKWTPAFIEYIDKEKCNGCGMCAKVCSRGVYEIQELNGRKISVAVNADNCVGDGICHIVCKSNAMICKPRRIEIAKIKADINDQSDDPMQLGQQLNSKCHSQQIPGAH